jgi:hypothetical protein
MADESASGGPLTATVGEQLAGKGHLDAVHEAERAVGAGGGRAPGRAGGSSARLPWGALAAGAAVWLLARRVERLLRRR